MPQIAEPCALDACEVDPAEEVPEQMAARDLDEYEFELDSWARWDQPSDFTEYFDLRLTPESDTGYDGSRIWRFIHQKVCFDVPEYSAPEEPAASRARRPGASGNGWRRDFNRAISGMHAAVSAHIVADIEDEEQALEQYRRRLRDEPGAIVNLYFAYMLTLCALKEAAPRLTACNFLGDAKAVQPLVKALTDSSLLCDPALQTAAFYLREHASSADCNLWEARMRMRDLLRVMDCVQCNLCRLHGKVTALGIASALRVLLGDSGRGGDVRELHRVEIGALVATAAKLGKACDVAERFAGLDTGESTSMPLARLMFSRFDHDGNGSIDAAELDSLLTAMGAPWVCLDGEERDDVLAALDSDNSGAIGFDEFIKWWQDGFSFEALEL